MLKFAVVGAAALFIAGCAEVTNLFGDGEFFQKAIEIGGKVDDETTGRFASVIALYCSKVPSVARKAVRDHLNSRTEMAGAIAAVWCPGESPVTLGQ